MASDPDALRYAIRPLLLRREVASVAADLPDRIDIDVALEMLAPEASGYDELLGHRAGRDRKSNPLALITKLRQFTAHPDLINGRADRPAERSAKFARFLEIADEITAGGGKALVFATFLEVADMIRDALSGRLGVPAWSIDGRTAVADRQAIVDAFSDRADSAFLVLNPVAAGLGLNIQAANHVIHYTLEWNPAREAQATARAWRRGQERPVTVHRLFYAGTIDEAIVERLEAKRELIDRVVKPSEDDDLSLQRLLTRALELQPTKEATRDNRTA